MLLLNDIMTGLKKYYKSIYLFIYYLLHLLYPGDTQSVITLFSMGAQGSNKIHQKAKTLHIKYTNSKGYMNRNKTKYINTIL